MHTFEKYSQLKVMLVEFTVGNFLSFKDKKTLSLSAASISDFKETNVIETERYNLLKGAVVYGANASHEHYALVGLRFCRAILCCRN
jgi:uncharacterized protein